MACKQCGKCCKTLVISDKCDEETLSMKKGYIGSLPYQGEKYYIFDLPCVYLIENKCSIYEDRPEMCKKFPGRNFSKFWGCINPKCGALENGGV